MSVWRTFGGQERLPFCKIIYPKTKGSTVTCCLLGPPVEFCIHKHPDSEGHKMPPHLVKNCGWCGLEMKLYGGYPCLQWYDVADECIPTKDKAFGKNRSGLPAAPGQRGVLVVPASCCAQIEELPELMGHAVNVTWKNWDWYQVALKHNGTQTDMKPFDVRPYLMRWWGMLGLPLETVCWSAEEAALDRAKASFAGDQEQAAVADGERMVKTPFEHAAAAPNGNGRH